MSRLTAATPHANEEKIKEAWAEDKDRTAYEENKTRWGGEVGGQAGERAHSSERDTRDRSRQHEHPPGQGVAGMAYWGLRGLPRAPSSQAGPPRRPVTRPVLSDSLHSL